MHAGDRPMTTTLCTIEFAAEGKGTRLILTDQSAFYGDEKLPTASRVGARFWTSLVAY